MERAFGNRQRVFIAGFAWAIGAALSGCAPNVSLNFHPEQLSPGPVNYAARLPYRFGFVPLEDDRYVPSGSGDFYLIGWGTGTGTLDTRSNVSRFVTGSYVRSFQHLGIKARIVSIKGLEKPGDLEKHLGTLASDAPDIHYLVIGSIRDFQFQISHPRFNMGTEFSLLATGVAWIKCQERVTLHLYSVRSGREIGHFTAETDSIRKTRGKDQAEFIRDAEKTLDRNLGKVVMKSVEKIDEILRNAPP